MGVLVNNLSETIALQLIRSIAACRTDKEMETVIREAVRRLRLTQVEFKSIYELDDKLKNLGVPAFWDFY